MVTKLFVVIVSLQSILLISGFKHFQLRLPNGDSVPHPCKPNYIYHGVGHKNARGSGERNPFGVAFEQAGKQWTKALCQADTDGDGKTNGEELGDPSCTWTPGNAPSRTTGITHPGICDPLDSDKCKGKNYTWLSCDPEDDFRCDALNEVDVKNVTVRFPTTKVPNTETNYYCMVFDLPQDDDYHLTATVPHIDNAYVMHHIILYGCDESQGSVKMPLNTPQTCGMGDDKCSKILSLWAVGFAGHCLHRNIGIRFGNKGFKRGMLQFHYNNPELRSDYVDSSGLKLFYTTKHRQFDAGVLSIGQMHIDIPPQKEQVDVVGTCHSYCTQKQLSAPVYVTAAYNHMHYLGRRMKIEQFRNGVKIRTITDDIVYSYDDPVEYDYEQPFELRPGDELNTTCVYKSTSRSMTTEYGDGTADEMCFGFLTYYPEANINIPYCYSWKSLPLCKLWYYYHEKPVIQGCDFHKMADLTGSYSRNISENITKFCTPFGPCKHECLQERKRLKDHPCLTGDIEAYLRNQLKTSQSVEELRFWGRYDSCHAEMNEKPCVCKECPPTFPPIGAASYHVSSYVMFLMLLVISCFT